MVASPYFCSIGQTWNRWLRVGDCSDLLGGEHSSGDSSDGGDSQHRDGRGYEQPGEVVSVSAVTGDDGGIRFTVVKVIPVVGAKEYTLFAVMQVTRFSHYYSFIQRFLSLSFNVSTFIITYKNVKVKSTTGTFLRI